MYKIEKNHCENAVKLGDLATFKDEEMYNIENEILQVKDEALFECVTLN